MKLTAKLHDVLSAKCDILILGLFEKQAKLNPLQDSVDKALGCLISDYLLKNEGFIPKFGESYLLQTYNKIGADKILVMGLGKKEEFTADKLREAGAKAYRCSNSIVKNKKILIEPFGENSYDTTKAMADGILIASYDFNKYKSKKKPSTISSIDILSDENKAVELSGIVCSAMNFARDLVNEPAQYATPTKIAQIALDMTREFPELNVRVYDKKELETMRFGSFLAVGKGSYEEPKFIHITYAPKNAKKKIVIIGKGITFDSGGLNIKPPSSMLTMKTDMSGCACVLGTMKALAELGVNAQVHMLTAVCENMPGDKAYKLGDVLTAKNGKTIEVDNTDAEGRLTLADVLSFADELNADEIIDVATLTGACVIALGNNISGIMGRNQKMIDKIISAGKKCGESLWQLPMTEDMQDALKSDVADMRNTGSRGAGASVAGAFLSNFVKNKNWVHIDIAGTAFADKPHRELGKGATGSMVRTLVNYISTSSV